MSEAKTKKFLISDRVDLSTMFARSALVGLCVGHTGEVLLVVDADRSTGTTGVPTIVRVRQSDVSTIALQTGGWRFHFAQPLPGGDVLAVNARCEYRGRDDYDKNARVYDAAGSLKRAFTLGDGIQSAQATADGHIWTSYFDEGIFGNMGWTTPIGANGLICWNAFGERMYEYQAPAGCDSICDCYALNVVSDREVWFYYYTEFRLVRLSDRKTIQVWDCPLAGSTAVAIHKSRALFNGGYDNRDEYFLYELAEDSSMRLIGRYMPIDANGDPLKASAVASRQHTLYLLSNSVLYTVRVDELPV